MQSLTRRNLSVKGAQYFIGCGLMSLMAGRRVFAENGSFADWFHALNEKCERLHNGQITPAQWQRSLDDLYGRIPLQEMLNNLDFDRIRAEFDWNGAGERFIDVRFNVPGMPENQVMETKIAGVQRGRSIYPHGHSNMVSAFLTVSGEFHVRQFDTIGETDTHLLIKPSTDEASVPGTWSSISDQKNNVHWLTATTEDSFLFSTKLVNIDPQQRTRGRIPIDPRGENLGSGVIKAEKITHSRAQELFG